MDRSDAELVAAASRGDSVAFGELAGRHERRLRQLARTVLGDPAEAEDVAQDAILAAYLDLGRLRDPERFGSWLFGIGLNLARMSSVPVRLGAGRRLGLRLSRPSRPLSRPSRPPSCSRSSGKPSRCCRRPSATSCSCTTTKA